MRWHSGSVVNPDRTDEDRAAQLRCYANVIETARWTVEAGERGLIVTAGKAEQ